MVFAVFGNRYQNLHGARLGTFFECILARDPEARLLVDVDFLEYLAELDIIPRGAAPLTPSSLADVEMALSFGGDGTLLRAAKRVAPREIPVIGINTGHLGYLAAVSPADPAAVVERLYTGCYAVERRAMLAVEFAGDPPPGVDFAAPGSNVALNEVAVLKQDSASMVTVEARLNDHPLADYRADGLIVATPTGSTGYNLSVGGPIVAPTSPVWVISPIAAHTLTMRPMVVPDDSSLALTVRSRSDSFLLSLDGSSQTLPAGSTLLISKAPFVTRIVVSRSYTFVDSLREKLLWGI